LGTAVSAIILLMHEAAPRGGRSERAAALLVTAQQCFAALSSAGPFMPADLYGPTTDLANEFFDCLKDVVEWSDLNSQGEREARCVQTTERMTEISNRSKQLFGDWQAQQFQEFTSRLDEIDTRNAPGPEKRLTT